MPCSEEFLKLGRMRELVERLGRPQDRLPIVHIAGTKGKGSTAALIASILTAAGYRTGLFTSPHLERVEERIVLDGRQCPTEEFAALIEQVRPVIEQMDLEAAALQPPEQGPTYFEILTALALCHFARRGATAAVLEVGLGGRLDSTNVCQPCVSIITSISFDHTKQLGNTLAAIAGEKAGIIKPGVPVISGVTEAEPRDVIRRVAEEHACRLIELGRDFCFEYQPPRHLEQAATPGRFDFYTTGLDRPLYQALPVALPGHHQATNAAVALAAVEELRQTGWTISRSSIEQGLSSLTWPARVEVVARRPCVVLDAAHNVASIAVLVKSLEDSFVARQRLLIFATTQEKDVRGMLELLLGRFDRVFFTQYQKNPRAVPAHELQALAQQLTGNEYPAFAAPADAWAAAEQLATAEDLICITGSFFLAAEMRALAVRPLTSG